ncbi:U2 small nuclear ribonucleoprotein auxiliary factor 35 kDa subunit-related protein 1-like [Kryptolebias marmoratus]|uniref:U2 small nuclear ribonucleoprotein auxiliary factor 35 kDa subunit-related protein 1-like n=1 Tax=Kryptolebias marmoratus TaxID=37003 RepID=UPI0018ACD3C4|nr:U2 small nuclear ribonucleoprotein auxiliary factor 35 kDa subunit-related protein 1-like [Kryptolebias marmoratus]
MAHVTQFQSIPMSKSMRGLCKEEDYAFLGMPMSPTKEEGHAALQDNWRDKKEDRVRRRVEREKREQERLNAIEESKKEKERQWKVHIADLTSRQEKNLQDRLMRLRQFREFQRKVLEEEEGMEGEAASQLLTRM